jgi:hypothetical protein
MEECLKLEKGFYQVVKGQGLLEEATIQHGPEEVYPGGI